VGGQGAGASIAQREKSRLEVPVSLLDAILPWMKQEIARANFLEAVAGPDEDIGLAEAALWVAAEADPELDVAKYCSQLDFLAESVRGRIDASDSDPQRVDVLNQFLFREQEFRGNAEDYYDSRNSYLNEVLDRRRGIPITLAIVWISVARRLGMDARGVGFPGHFLAMLRSSPSIWIDAFAGIQISEEGCRARLHEMAGPEVRFDTSMLKPVTSREIIARVLRNLKQIHIGESQLWDAVACADRILALEPDQPHELRDRGLLYRALECWLPARADLERFLEVSPEAPEAGQVREFVADLQVRTARLH